MKSFLSAARKALDESDFDVAIENCNTVIDKDPDNYNAHLFKGFAFSKTGKEDDAIKEFEIAVSLNPESPLAFQGLIAASQHNPSRLIHYYERLAQLHAKDQHQKYYDDLLKMIKVYKTLNDHDSVIKTWEKMLPRSSEYGILKDHLQFSPVEIWNFILQTATEKDEYDYEEEWQTQKYRIQSKSMELVKKDIEKQVGEAIENILIQIKKDKVYYLLCNRLVNFLYKRIQYTENIAYKEKILERIFQICEFFHSSSEFDEWVYIEPFSIEFELKDYAIDDYDLDLVKRISTCCRDTRFGINCALIYAIRRNDNDIKDLIQNTASSPLEADFITSQVMAFAYARIGFDEKVIEWGKSAQSILKTLSEISGNSYDKRSENLDYLIASSLLRLGGSHLAESLSIYRRLMETNPASHNALLGICEIYVRLQSWKGAAEYADKCLENNENDHQALAARGWVAFHQKDLGLALKLIRKANDLYRDATYLYKLGRVYWEMGGQYRDSKEYAMSYFLQSAKENSNYAPPFCYLGFYYDLVMHDSTRSMKCFQKSIQLDPLNSEANKALVLIKLKAKKQNEAIELLQAYCDHYPRNDWAHKLLGDLLINSAKYADAIFHLNQSLRYDDKNSSIWTALGEALSHEGKYVAASKAFYRALKVSHDGDEQLYISYLLSAVHLKLGDILDAITLLQKIVEVIPNHFPSRVKLVEARISLAHEKRKEGRYAAYKIILEKALSDSLDGIKTASKPLWLLRFAGRILTLFLKDKISCDSDLLEKAWNELKTFKKESDSKFLEDYQSAFDSSSFGSLFKCCVISLVISSREAHELEDLQAFCLYDLALCTYYAYMICKDNIIILKKATQIIRLCVEILPDSAMFWNAAGVLLQNVDLARSQHCLIKATYLSNLDHSWVNLVFLAIKIDDIEFSQQLINHKLISIPENPKLWLAKSIISKLLHKNEYMTVLEHAFQLSDGDLPDVNYLYLEQSLISNDSKAIENALINVQKVVDFVCDDVAYINLMALAFERLGNYRQGLALLKKIESVSKGDDSETKIAFTSNLVRLLCTSSLYQSAMDIFDAVCEQKAFKDSFNLIYLSLCYFKLERYEECLETMDTAIENSTDSLVEMELLVFLGRVIFCIDEIDGNIEIAKEQFLRCITLDVSSLEALFGLLAISIVLKDKTISESVLVELEKCQKYTMDIFYWIGAYQELMGRAKIARTYYLKSCHQFPTSPTSWNHLIRFLLKTEPESAIYGFNYADEILDSHGFPEKIDTYIQTLYLKGLYLYSHESITDSCKLLKKALHLQPDNPKILAALYICQTSDSGRLHIQKILEFLSDQGRQDAHFLLAKLKLHFDSNNLKEARSIITYLENSTDNENNLRMSILFYYLGEFENALNCVKKYLESSSNINGLEILAAVCTKLKLWSDAESAHNLALELCRLPNEKIVIQYRLLKLYMELGEHKSSSEELNKLYQIEGESPMQKLIQAILHKRNGNQNKCEKILDSIDHTYRKWFDLI